MRLYVTTYMYKGVIVISSSSSSVYAAATLV